MDALPRLLVAVASSVALAFGPVATASAAHDLRDVPSAVRDGPVLASSGGRFLIHYTTDPASPDATTADVAAHLGDVLEAAYAQETGPWGWPLAVDDGDGKVDLYVYTQAGVEGSAHFDPGPRPVAGWLQFDAQAEDLVIAHELLHLLQDAVPGTPAAAFLTEGTAHWAGNRFVGDRPGAIGSIPLWANSNYLGTPLECPATSPCHDNAGPATATWPFFEFLAERFGPQVVADVYGRGQADDGTSGGDARAVAAELGARGTSLGAVVTDYAIATASGTWALPSLRPYYPRPAAVLGAKRSGQRLATSVTLDHLSQGAVYGQPGCSNCNLALRVTVSWPAALTGVRPAWVRHDLGLVKRLKVTGSSATGVVPVDGTNAPAMLILANPSSELDGMRFDVSAKVVPGPPPVVQIVAATPARRSGARVIKLQMVASTAGRVRVRFGKVRQLILVPAGSSAADLYVPRSLHGTVKLKLTPLDARGRRGRTVSAPVTLG
jgi:hypothetical protein